MLGLIVDLAFCSWADWEVQSSVICKKSYSGFDLLRQVIYVCKEENWAENWALRDAREDWDFIWIYSFNYNCLFSIVQKVFYPFKSVSSLP